MSPQDQARKWACQVADAVNVWYGSRTAEHLHDVLAREVQPIYEEIERSDRELAIYMERAEAAERRVKEQEASMAGHFQRDHLEGDGPEIDRWRLKVEMVQKERDGWEARCRELEAERDALREAVAGKAWRSLDGDAQGWVDVANKLREGQARIHAKTPGAACNDCLVLRGSLERRTRERDDAREYCTRYSQQLNDAVNELSEAQAKLAAAEQAVLLYGKQAHEAQAKLRSWDKGYEETLERAERAESLLGEAQKQMEAERIRADAAEAKLREASRLPAWTGIETLEAERALANRLGRIFEAILDDGLDPTKLRIAREALAALREARAK